MSSKSGDELSTESIAAVQEVRDGDRLLGETAYNDEPTREGWVYRDAYHVEWGDVPGQLTGWTGAYRTRGAAERALRDALAEQAERDAERR